MGRTKVVVEPIVTQASKMGATGGEASIDVGRVKIGLSSTLPFRSTPLRNFIPSGKSDSVGPISE